MPLPGGGWYYIAHYDRFVAGLRKTQSQVKLTIIHTDNYKEILCDLSQYGVGLLQASERFARHGQSHLTPPI